MKQNNKRIRSPRNKLLKNKEIIKKKLPIKKAPGVIKNIKYRKGNIKQPNQHLLNKSFRASQVHCKSLVALLIFCLFCSSKLVAMSSENFALLTYLVLYQFFIIFKAQLASLAPLFSLIGLNACFFKSINGPLKQ